MVCFVDSNVFLRVAVRENEKIFRECFEFFKASREGKIKVVTANIVFAEVVWSLSTYYKFPKEKIIAALEGFRNLKIQMDDKYHFDRAFDLFQRLSVKYIDCLIGSVKEVETQKWTVVSYDKDFDRLGVLRKEPRHVLREVGR